MHEGQYEVIKAIEQGMSGGEEEGSGEGIYCKGGKEGGEWHEW